MYNFIVQKVINKIGNRFNLVLIASLRARQIQFFSKNNYLKELKNDKVTILALKEINNGLVDSNILKMKYI